MADKLDYNGMFKRIIMGGLLSFLTPSSTNFIYNDNEVNDVSPPASLSVDPPLVTSEKSYRSTFPLCHFRPRHTYIF